MDTYDFAAALPQPTTPMEKRDHALGRADAYDEHHAGTSLDNLEGRYEWLLDPRVSHYTAAYLNGYRAYIEDARAHEYATARAYTTLGRYPAAITHQPTGGTQS